MTSADRPTLVMLHGWMDVAASFQFVVDAMREDRHVLALDWRGFGASDTPAIDTYYFTEYLGDLELVLDASSAPTAVPIDLLGHSMGGNVAMLYSGVRPDKIRRLVNLEGFGMPRSRPEHAPARIAKWLDELKTPMQLKPYRDLDAVAARLQKTNPLLRADRAAWLAAHWSKPTRGDAGGERALLADANHKRMSPLAGAGRRMARKLEADHGAGAVGRGRSLRPEPSGGATATPRPSSTSASTSSPTSRRHVVAPAGHMLHHDRPEDIAELVESFLSESRLRATPPIE